MKTNQNLEEVGAVRSIRERAGGPGLSEKSLRREIAAGNIEIVRLGPGRRRIGITDRAWERYLRSRTS